MADVFLEVIVSLISLSVLLRWCDRWDGSPLFDSVRICLYKFFNSGIASYHKSMYNIYIFVPMILFQFD